MSKRAVTSFCIIIKTGSKLLVTTKMKTGSYNDGFRNVMLKKISSCGQGSNTLHQASVYVS